MKRACFISLFLVRQGSPWIARFSGNIFWNRFSLVPNSHHFRRYKKVKFSNRYCILRCFFDVWCMCRKTNAYSRGTTLKDLILRVLCVSPLDIFVRRWRRFPCFFHFRPSQWITVASFKLDTSNVFSAHSQIRESDFEVSFISTFPIGLWWFCLEFHGSTKMPCQTV